MAKLKYRVLVVKYKDVPKNLYSKVFHSEEEAVQDAKNKLQQLHGDAVIVTKVEGTTTELIHRFESAKAGTPKAVASSR